MTDMMRLLLLRAQLNHADITSCVPGLMASLEDQVKTLREELTLVQFELAAVQTELTAKHLEMKRVKDL